MRRIWKLHADARKNCFTWYQYLSWFIRFCQHMYCFLHSFFINVFNFILNPFGSYSTFVGADLEYLNSLRQEKSSWFGLSYPNFEPSLKLWWRRLARDFDGSQILVTSEGFQGFLRFLSFEISKLRAFVCITIFTIISNMNYC